MRSKLLIKGLGTLLLIVTDLVYVAEAAHGRLHHGDILNRVMRKSKVGRIAGPNRTKPGSILGGEGESWTPSGQRILHRNVIDADNDCV